MRAQRLFYEVRAAKRLQFPWSMVLFCCNCQPAADSRGSRVFFLHRLPQVLRRHFLLIIAWLCYRKGGKLGISQSFRGASEMPIGFTFYLRSFIDDASEASDSILEEIAVMALWPFDPVVCLGRSLSQPLGALRFDVVGDDWQALATRLFHSANRILLMLSFTTGLAWELHEIFRQRLQGKLILLVPHELPTQKAARWGWSGHPLAAEQLLTHWNESIGGTPVAA